jgi:glycosyltransferase involved in cell wall biosynthesis
MTDTAIIIGTYNRAHLLRRSLLHYPDWVDIYILDDGSTDETFDVSFSSNKNIKYYFLEGKEPGKWRDSASYLNRAIRAALAMRYQYIFITHPEIIPGKTTIESAKALATDKETWVSCKGYYLTPEQQEQLKDDAQAKHLPNFYGQYSAEFRGNKDYLPENIEKINVWHSWIFGGGSREMWQYFGGLTPFEVWGSIDVDLLNRRVIAGMKTVTPNKETDIVIHQNHDDPAINTPTPRDMEKCMAALPRYTSKEQALKPHLIL